MTGVDDPRLGEEPAGFRCEVVREDPRVAVCVAGDVDMATAPRVGEAVAEAVAAAPAADVVVDLGACTFLDSSGLAVLVEAAKRVRSAGRAFSIRGAGEQVVRLIDLTHLHDELPTE